MRRLGEDGTEQRHRTCSKPQNLCILNKHLLHSPSAIQLPIHALSHPQLVKIINKCNLALMVLISIQE